ncbi:nucleotidyltransferase domain-containing protein [Candidatus Saccharibacteria bacterium]|nr:nucleotidyltransferase domain-containing protein [Candidatus Saccharibacteria bacterium]
MRKIPNLDAGAELRSEYDFNRFAEEDMFGNGHSESLDPAGIKERADAQRNPNQDKLIGIATEYSQKLKALLPDGAIVRLGGSLVSGTALRGNNDIDLRLLLPDSQATEKDIRDLSDKISPLVPYEKDQPAGRGEHQQFAVLHHLDLEAPGIDGPVEIDLSIRPAGSSIGNAMLQNNLPEQLLDEYVVYKAESQPVKANYKKIKEQFYAMNRWLFNRGYMDESIDLEAKERLLDEAKGVFWGSSIEEILKKPTPES